jgi:hypothetical protein
MAKRVVRNVVRAVDGGAAGERRGDGAVIACRAGPPRIWRAGAGSIFFRPGCRVDLRLGQTSRLLDLCGDDDVPEVNILDAAGNSNERGDLRSIMREGARSDRRGTCVRQPLRAKP